MAAPKNPQRGPNPKKAPKRNRSKPGDPLFETTRDAIATSHIVKRLNSFVLNEDGIEMTAAQLTGAKMLLDRVLPTLQSTVFKGDADNPIAFVNKIELTAPNDNSSS